jgi:hypothetical protein
MNSTNQIHTERSFLWKTAIGTMIFVTLTSLSWHFGDLRVVREQEQKETRGMEQDIVVLRGYHDAIKKEGIPGGKTYLTNPLNSTYEF